MQVFVFLAVLLLPSAAFAQDVAAPVAIEKPAAATAAKPAWMEYHDPYTGEQNDLNNPHRTTEEIVAYGQGLATNGLTLAPDNFNEELTKFKTMFSAEGWAAYATYLKESRLADMVRVESYHVNTIVNGDTIVLGQGGVSGSYRWLVQAPILMTFLQKTPDGGLREINTGRFKLTLQLGRVAVSPENPEGLQIQSWKVESVSAAE
jgi:hypothetical protein